MFLSAFAAIVVGQTCVAGAAAPTRGAAAEERVAVIQTRPAVTAGLRVALALTCTEASWEMELRYTDNSVKSSIQLPFNTHFFCTRFIISQQYILGSVSFRI